MRVEPDDALRRLVDNPAFPRSAKYDPRWVRENMMEPNVLWLAKSPGQVLEFRPEHRILDLGCGRGLGSIFLANEFGAQVCAADIWIKPWENWKRILEAGCR
jgi:cyclopropane fatty-acyl-phospholipid synthase-like methyltransferase